MKAPLVKVRAVQNRTNERWRSSDEAAGSVMALVRSPDRAPVKSGIQAAWQDYSGIASSVSISRLSRITVFSEKRAAPPTKTT
jgi:hypothetical protein